MRHLCPLLHTYAIAAPTKPKGLRRRKNLGKIVFLCPSLSFDFDYVGRTKRRSSILVNFVPTAIRPKMKLRYMRTPYIFAGTHGPALLYLAINPPSTPLHYAMIQSATLVGFVVKSFLIVLSRIGIVG